MEVKTTGSDQPEVAGQRRQSIGTIRNAAGMDDVIGREGVLYPELVRSEKEMEAAAFLDLSNSESPQFVGRAAAGLATDPEIIRKTEQVVVAAELARENEFTDIDGKQPQPLMRDEI